MSKISELPDFQASPLGARLAGSVRSDTVFEGKAVGAPLVDAAAATLVLSEVQRLLHGGAVYELIDLDLKGLAYRTTVVTRTDFTPLNPGYVLASQTQAGNRR
jgi:hypothetical protein